MILKNILHSYESYTHENWVYRDVCVGFSRLYYIIDGEAYYEENGQKHRLKKGYLYLTPVKKPFTLYENPEDKLLHTYSHIVTVPPVTEFTEIEVLPDTPLADSVALWRKYIFSEDGEMQAAIIRLLLSCIDRRVAGENGIAERVKEYIDLSDSVKVSMTDISRAVGYSREHITRVFSAAYNMTPRQYINIRKMGAALSDLVNGKKIYEVAESMGFSSQYAFSKAFKKYYGLSPEKYLPTLDQLKEERSVPKGAAP